MTDWKTRLYGSYVSTKQAQVASVQERPEPLRLSDYPQLRNIIKKYVPADRSLRIADLGCGHGSLIFCLRALGYTNVEGVDVSSEQVAMAGKLGISGVAHGGIMDFLIKRDHAYDVIFLMDVLEHLTKQELIDLLERVRHALSEGGRLIIHVPNAEGLYGMRVRYGDLTHEICFTPQSIGQALRAVGFSDIAVFEDKPVVHGMASLVRRALWEVLTLRERLLLLAETGAANHVLSQNMLVVTGR